MANITDATNAYSAALTQLKKVSGDSAPVEGGSFGDLLKHSLTASIDAQKKSEQVSAAALAGKADMTDVLQAITEAEMALNTVLAVRDRVVQAYDQIMRTQI